MAEAVREQGKQSWLALFIPPLIAAVIWFLDSSVAIKPLEGSVYDLAASTAATTPPRVLLLEHPPDGFADSADTAVKILTTLKELGARQVVFLSAPPDAPRAFFELAAQHGNVVFGRSVVADERATRWADLPAAAAGLPLDCGAVALPPTVYGVARQQRAAHVVGEQTLPALAVVAARQRLGADFVLQEPSFHVRFRHPPVGLPRVALDALLTGRLVPELFAEQTVLIGPASAGQPGLVTPTTAGQPTMSLLEYQGQALDTLLSGVGIRSFGSSVKLGLLLMAALASALVFRRLQVRWVIWGGAILSVGLVALTAFLFVYVFWWLPLISLLATIWCCLFWVIRSQAALALGEVKELVQNVSFGLRDSRLPLPFHQSQDPWQLLVPMVTQTLNLSRTVFLEAVPGKRHLRVAALGHCTAEEIHERRRDYRRDPYAAAARAREAVRVEGLPRPFFKAAAPGEQAYLVPLLFEGQLMGFWALALDGERAAAVADLEALIKQYADQIAELLYRRCEFLAASQPGSRLGRYLLAAGEVEECHALGRLVKLLERRLHRSELMFSDSTTPTIAYDLFGRVREVNAAMLECFERLGLDATQTSLVDFVARLTGNPPDFARRCLRHVVHEKGRLTLPVTGIGNRHYLLQVYALKMRKAQAWHEPSAFNVLSVCAQLVDQTALIELDSLKERLTERLGDRLRNDLAAVDLSASLLAGDDLSAAERIELAEMAHVKVQHAVEKLAEAQTYFARDLPDEGRRLPVDGLAALESALQEVEARPEAREVAFQISKPEAMNDVLAAPRHLQQLFVHVLTTMANNCPQRGVVSVCVAETDKVVSFMFATCGFGFSQERLRDCLFGDSAPTSSDLRELRTSIGWVEGWGGAVEARPAPGADLSLTLDLCRFV